MIQVLALGVLLLSGRIEPQAAVDLARYQQDHPVTTLVLRSPGGDLQTALLLGDMVRAWGTVTAVPAGATCASACAVVWRSAAQRSAGEGARIGLHTPRGQVATMVDWARAVGLDDGDIVAMLRAGPSEMYWLEPEQ